MESKGRNISELDLLTIKLRAFVSERDWHKFHTPKNLVKALSGEVGELIEHFQWLGVETDVLTEQQEEEVKKEVADVFIYLLMLSDKLEIDLCESAYKKITLNAQKCPSIFRPKKNNGI